MPYAGAARRADEGVADALTPFLFNNIPAFNV
jgi:hypothetical protein